MASQLARRRLAARIVVTVLLAFSSVHGLSVLAAQAHAFGQVKQQSKQDILASAQLISSGVRIIGDRPDPRHAPDLTVMELSEMQRDGKLPAGDTVTDIGRLDAALALQVAVGSSPILDEAASVTIEPGAAGLLVPAPDGCLKTVSFGPALSLIMHFQTAGFVRVEAATPEVVQVTLAEPMVEGHSMARQIFVPRDGTFISNSRPLTSLTLVVSSNPIEICGHVALASAGNSPQTRR